MEEVIFACVYCGRAKGSPNGTGSDVRCCGEIGHVERYDMRGGRDNYYEMLYQADRAKTRDRAISQAARRRL